MVGHLQPSWRARYAYIEGILPKGPYPPCVRHAIGPFWQDTLDIRGAQRFDVDVGQHKLLNKHSNDRWFETTWHSCDIVIMHNTLRWRHNECDSVSNHQPHDCLLSRLSGCRSKWPVTRKMFHLITSSCNNLQCYQLQNWHYDNYLFSVKNVPISREILDTLSILSVEGVYSIS